jgi:adenylate cyclase
VDTAEWEAAGLYRPDDAGADDRRALLEFLTARGATVAQMIEAHQSGNLPGVAGDLVVGHDRPALSVGEMADRAQVPPERLQRILLAAGLPVTADSELPADLVDVTAAFEQGAALMGDDAILAFTRVLGASATNIAEAAVAVFFAELGPGTDREGSTELERAQQSEMATAAFTAVPGVLRRILLAQFDRAVHRISLGRGWSSGVEGSDTPSRAELGEVIALGFVDLVGSTAWAETLSLRDQNLGLSRFESTAWSSAVLAGGRVVKMIGDEVFFSAPSVEAGCRIALEVCGAVAADPVLPPARGAVGFGLVTPREGDYFGPLVNLISRLVKSAEPGAVLVTADAAAALPDGGGWTTTEINPQVLRGVEHPVRAFAVRAPGDRAR